MPETRITIGTFLIFTSIALIFSGFILLLLSAIGRSSEVSGGVIIFVGPIPIGAAWGPHGPLLMLIGVIITLTMLAILYLMLKSFKIENWEETT